VETVEGRGRFLVLERDLTLSGRTAAQTSDVARTRPVFEPSMLDQNRNSKNTAEGTTVVHIPV
jgi:hypothetical protein